jgi:hypothetical protein
MYLLANQWVKPVTRGTAGFASTFHTTLDQTKKQRGNQRDKKNQRREGKRNPGKPKTADKKEQDKRDNIECFACGELWHYANKCPTRKADNNEDDDINRNAHVTWDASTFATYRGYATGMVGKFKRTEVLLDNQGDVSVIHPTLLRELEPAEEDVRINGVGGHQFTVEETGYLDDFFHVYASTVTYANVLSFAEVEDRFPITYIPRESFTVHLQDRDIVFNRRGKMYVADWEQVRSAYATTGVYTKAKELRAKRAYDLLRTSGYPSMTEVHVGGCTSS